MGAWVQVKGVIARRLGSMSGVNGLLIAWATAGLVQTAWHLCAPVAPATVAVPVVEQACRCYCESLPSECVACPAAREVTRAPADSGFSWWTALALVCLELAFASLSCAACLAQRWFRRVLYSSVTADVPRLEDSRRERVSERASRRRLGTSESVPSSTRGSLAHLSVDASEL